ncbi:MAG: hypothetical protein HC915_05730 [Anaerolineae bacterium]|nr:hypothetical protein [Anaerolineae bacterium]
MQETLRGKDVVLVKGSSLARMERVVAALLANPERDLPLLSRQDAPEERLDASLLSPTRIEVDMQAIAHNVSRLKALVGSQVRLMAVVKGDAYGHGAVPVSTTAVLNGADWLGVASVEEAFALRQAGITAPLLVMGYTPPALARQVILQDITISLYDLASAKTFDRVAAEVEREVKAHVRVDLGLSGLGLLPDEVSAFFRGVLRLERLRITGLYFHMSSVLPDMEACRAIWVASRRW